MHAGGEPARLDHAHHGGGRGGDHLGAVHGRVRVIHGADVHAVQLARLGDERVPRLLARTVDAHLLELAHGERRGELRAGLPAAADEGQALDVRPGEVFESKTARRADAQALHHAVGKHGEQLPGLGAEEEHQPHPASVRQRLLDAAWLAID